MTVTVEPPTEHRSRFVRRTKVVLGIGCALLLVWALVVGLHWWTHPDLIPDHGDGMDMRPAPVAEAAHSAAVTFPEPPGHPATLTFRAAHAVLATDTAHARVSFAICHIRRGADVIGFVGSDLSPYCSDVRPLVDGTRLTYPNAKEYVVVVVTPTRPGTTHLVGADLTYSLGASRLFRHGTDSVAMDLRVHAR